MNSENIINTAHKEIREEKKDQEVQRSFYNILGSTKKSVSLNKAALCRDFGLTN